jgi:hypothetical protein
MTSAADILRSAGITTKFTAPGRYYATCPRCSLKRKPAHQKLDCLGITIDEKGVTWGCNHCDWKGGGFYESHPAEKKNGGGYSPVIAQYVYKQADGTPYLKVCKTANKKFLQFRWNGSGWIAGKPKGPKIPYRLPELLATSVGTIIYFCEGEKDADALHALHLIGTTCSEGAPNGWRDELAQWFKGRRVCIMPDNDKPGRDLARRIAKSLHGIADTVKVVELPGLKEKGDVSDFLKHDSAGIRLLDLCRKVPLWEPSADSGEDENKDRDDELIVELAALSRLAYAKRRRDAAKQLGITAGELDRIIAQARSDSREKRPAPALYLHWNVEPAGKPADGDILLRSLIERLRRYVIMNEDQALVIALWIVFTWLHEQIAVHSPILLVTSPLPNSGKTTLLKLMSFLARNGLPSVSITGPALFRSIEKWAPTIAIDEADTAFVNNDDLKDVVNSGWTRGDSIIRCDPETHEPRPYSTFCPKAIGMIGRELAEATLSRCLIIAMRRKRPEEQADDFDHVDDEHLALLRCQLLRWATDNAEALVRAAPEIPPGLYNRARMNWRPLLAIAERAGWKRAAWKAVLAIEEVRDASDPAIVVQLLSDIRDAFDRLSIDRMTSKTLLAELARDEEGPWLSYGKRGQPITDRQLSRLLRGFNRGFGIKPVNIRIPGTAGVARGYRRADFEDDFACYLPRISGKTPLQSATPLQVNDVNSLASKLSATPDFSVADRNEPNPLEIRGCSGVAGGNPPPGDERDGPPQDPPPGEVEDRTCAQCRGPVDGKERQVATGHKTAWLHPECERFYLQAETMPW